MVRTKVSTLRKPGVVDCKVLIDGILLLGINTFEYRALTVLEALRDLFYRRKFHSNLALYLDLGGVVHSCNAVRTNTHKTIFKRGNGISLLDK